MKLNLGCGRNPIDGYVNIDSADLPGVDVVFNLDVGTGVYSREYVTDKTNQLWVALCRFDPTLEDTDGQVITEVYGSHVFEHIRGHLFLMDMLYQLAAPDCTATFLTPHGASDDAFADPTHVRPLFPGSWLYYAQPMYWRADYGYRGDWQCTELVLDVDDRFAGMHPGVAQRTIARERNVVQQMTATLVARKPAREPLRELQELPAMTMRCV